MAYGTTDWFAKASSGVRELQDDDISRSYAVDATAEDSNGDVACRTKAGAMTEYTNSYRLIGGGDTTANDINLDTIAQVGQVVSYDTVTHIQVKSVELGTDNKSRPLLTLKGVQDPGTTATTHAVYASGLTVKPIKAAQGFGLSADTGSSIISGSASLTGSEATVQDSVGDFALREQYGVQMKGSHTLQACSGTAAGSVDTGYTLDNPAGGSTSSSNTGYGTTTIDVYKDIAQT